MTKYEVMYILSSNLNDGEKEAFIEKFSALVKSHGGEVENVNKMGNRRLAYPINFKNEGYYVLMTYAAPADFNAEFERNLRIYSGEVMRFMITKKIINSKTPAPKVRQTHARQNVEKPAVKPLADDAIEAAIAEDIAAAIAVEEEIIAPAVEEIIAPAVEEVIAPVVEEVIAPVVEETTEEVKN